MGSSNIAQAIDRLTLMLGLAIVSHVDTSPMKRLDTVAAVGDIVDMIPRVTDG